MTFVQVIWCVDCQCAVAWSLMANSELPAVHFELLYIFFLDEAIRIAYDNGCNFLSYALNRDPKWAAGVRVRIDTPHYQGHKTCADSLNTGMW
jgi:hypothetical protein